MALTHTMQTGDIYTHYRNHQSYRILAIGHHTETLEKMVIYQALYTDPQFGDQAIWIRPLSMFLETVEWLGQMFQDLLESPKKTNQKQLVNQNQSSHHTKDKIQLSLIFSFIPPLIMKLGILRHFYPI